MGYRRNWIRVDGVANIPMRLPNVQEALSGQPATSEAFQSASARATEGTNPLPQTGYKVELLVNTTAVVLSSLEV